MEGNIDLVNSLGSNDGLISFKLIDNVKVIYIKRENSKNELYLQNDLVYGIDFNEVLKALEVNEEQFDDIIYNIIMPGSVIDNKTQAILYSFLPFDHKYDYE